MLYSNTYNAILNISLSPTFLDKINHPLLQEAWGGRNNIHKRNRWENVLSPAERLCGTRHNKESSKRWRQKVSSLLAPLNLIATRCHNASTAQTCLRAPSLLSGLEEKHQKNFSYCRSPFCPICTITWIDFAYNGGNGADKRLNKATQIKLTGVNCYIYRWSLFYTLHDIISIWHNYKKWNIKNSIFLL